jgi:general secretion pathway protein H
MVKQVAQASTQKLATGMRSSRGFTLTEILVVILIISITFGFALMAFGDFGKSREIKMATEQFANMIKLIQQQAILESSTLGLNIQKNAYKAYRYQAPDHWTPLPSRGIFTEQYFPKNATVVFQSNRKKNHQPDIVINSSGDQTPFILKVGTKKEFPLIILVGRHNGNLYFKHPKKEQ